MGLFGRRTQGDRRQSTRTRRDTKINLNDVASVNSEDTFTKREKFFTQIDAVSEIEDENSSDYIELMAGRLYKYCEAKSLLVLPQTSIAVRHHFNIDLASTRHSRNFRWTAGKMQ